MKKSLFLLLGIALSFSACQKQSDKDEELILEYISTNNLDALSTSDGLYYIINEEGTGDRPAVTDEVIADYEGYLLDGSVFDSSYERGQPSTFSLSGVILGWQIGIPFFKEGGSGKLIIPSELGYGSDSPSSKIPKNSVLVFDIELIEVL